MQKYKAILCILPFLLSPLLQGREVDQYLAMNSTLKDSGKALDEYFVETFYEGLDLINASKGAHKKSCTEVAMDVMRPFMSFGHQHSEKWADYQAPIERFPKRADLDDKAYTKASYIRWQPFNVPLSRVIKAHGVYFGADKLGHFTSLGRRYFGVYRRSIKKGMTQDKALEKAIDFGRTTEGAVLGKFASGIYSFADLEANFQGLLFLKSLCAPLRAPTDMRLIWSPKEGWDFINTQFFTMADYINPDWDETFNNSVMSFYKQKAGIKHIKKFYCSERQSPVFVKRHKRYKKQYSPSFTKQYFERIKFQDRTIQRQNDHSLEAICSNSKSE